MAVGGAANGPKNKQLARGKDLLHRMDLLTYQPVGLMNEGRAHYTSIVGAVLTIVMLIVVLALVCARATAVGNLESAAITRTLQDGYYLGGSGKGGAGRGGQHVGLAADGFNIAFGLGSYAATAAAMAKKAAPSAKGKAGPPQLPSNEAELEGAMMVDPNFGFLAVYYDNKRVEVEPCKKDASAFFKFGAPSQAQLQINFEAGRFYCPTSEAIERLQVKHAARDGLQGLFSIYFTPCDIVNVSDCEDQETFERWLVDKHLLLVYNQQTFNYKRALVKSPKDEDLIIRESHVMQFPFSPRSPKHHRMELQRTRVSFADSSTSASRTKEQFVSVVALPEQSLAPSG